MSSQSSSTAAPAAAIAQTALRPAEQLMQLARLGAFFPTRLSFLRSLIRTLAAQRAECRRTRWSIDDDGYGHAVYTVQLDGHHYSLIAFSSQLDPSDRTDRVIAEAWDATFNLFDGIPTEQDIERLRANTCLQEAGRFQPTELVLSRANKSVRLFNHVVERLAAGRQPDRQMILETGYLMRTTAVYGNGKFGIADRSQIATRSALAGPFQPELLTVWMIRGFTHDLVEHVARARNPASFVPLAQPFKRYLGVGNSTGLGMAPFLVSHPVLINNWMMARETALARVLAIDTASQQSIDALLRLIKRVKVHLQQWNVDDSRQQSKIDTLRTEFAAIAATLGRPWLERARPWQALLQLTDHQSLECQELVVALILEPHGELIDGLAHCMASDCGARLLPGESTEHLQRQINDHFQWALSIDFSDNFQTRQFWYISEDKLEPRLGDRHREPGAALEMPLDIARRVQSLSNDLQQLTQSLSVAEFLLAHPQHRYAISRVQTQTRYPYAEIQHNLIAGDCLPIDMLRCKLSFFGASKFDPRSERWTRITLCQGAPLSDELNAPDADDWWLPVLEPGA